MRSIRPTSLSVGHRISNLVPLGEVICEDSYGILTPGDVYAPDHPVTYVRVTDMRANMEVDYEQTLRVPEEYYRHARARLRKHDLLLAVKGASIASDKSVAFVKEPFPARSIVNGTIFRFQVKKEHNPFFIAVMLDSEILKGQIRDLQISNNAVSYVDKPSIHALRIPLPPRAVQDHIAQVMQDAYATRRAKLAEAEQVFVGIEGYVFHELGLDQAKLMSRRTALKPVSAIAGGRFDFEAVVASATVQFNHVKPVLLSRVARLVNDRVVPGEEFLGEDVNYIGLANIASHTGELAGFSPVKGESILSSSVSFRQGDILFGRMRPYLNKVWVDEFDGICSGEALVFRPDRSRVNTAFLHALLLSRITLNQVIPRQSGTSLPRVVASDVLRINLPIPARSGTASQNRVRGVTPSRQDQALARLKPKP